MKVHRLSCRTAALAALLVSGTLAGAQAPGGPPPAVTVAKPIVKEFTEVDSYTGRFNAVSIVDVRARVSGYLDKVNFGDGDFVKEGDVLLVIDQRPYKAALDQARAARDASKARVDFSKTDLERAEILNRQGNIAEQAADQRRQNAQTAQADFASAQANVAAVSLNLAFTEVRAPISGKISQRLVTIGNIVQADQTKLTTIVALDPIYFSFTVDERSFLTYQRTLGIGMGALEGSSKPAVMIALTGEERAGHPGKLDFVDNAIDQATGSILLRATVDNKDSFIKPGLFGTVRMPASKPHRGVLIPDEAVVANQDKLIVYVVADDGTVSSRDVQTGAKVDGYRVVEKGLDGQETIVIAGLTRVKPGIKVQPTRKDLPPAR